MKLTKSSESYRFKFSDMPEMFRKLAFGAIADVVRKANDGKHDFRFDQASEEDGDEALDDLKLRRSWHIEYLKNPTYQAVLIGSFTCKDCGESEDWVIGQPIHDQQLVGCFSEKNANEIIRRILSATEPKPKKSWFQNLFS